MKIFKNLGFISIFIIPFILSSIYILYFESELFKSIIYNNNLEI